MIREEHVLNEIHAYRYCGDQPTYALIISLGSTFDSSTIDQNLGVVTEPLVP
jgi:hypothetical protein